MSNAGQSLNERLYFLQKEIESKIDDEIAQLTEESIDELHAFNVEENALSLNDLIPARTLKNALGQEVSFSPESLDRETIILFYRGGWCPYCNIELNYYQENLANIQSKGYDLIAISPDLPDNSLTQSQKENLEYRILSDVNCELARGFGIAPKRPSKYLQMLSLIGFDIEEVYGSDNDYLPIPSLFVVSACLLYTSPSPRDKRQSRMPSSA